jgi:hypothetical protein
MASEHPEPNDKRVELEQRLQEIRKQYWERAIPGWQLKVGRLIQELNAMEKSHGDRRP